MAFIVSILEYIHSFCTNYSFRFQRRVRFFYSLFDVQISHFDDMPPRNKWDVCFLFLLERVWYVKFFPYQITSSSCTRYNIPASPFLYAYNILLLHTFSASSARSLNCERCGAYGTVGLQNALFSRWFQYDLLTWLFPSSNPDGIFAIKFCYTCIMSFGLQEFYIFVRGVFSANLISM